jgi:hypothetical protein
VKERVRVTASFCKMAVSSKLMHNNVCPLWKATTGSPEDQKQNILDYGFSEDNTKNASPDCRMSFPLRPCKNGSDITVHV